MNSKFLNDYLRQPTFGTTRDGFGRGLMEAAENPQVVVLSADLTDSMRLQAFKEKFPDRFIAMGVAEENMMGVAAGLALRGKIPVTGSFAVFSPGNSLGPLRASVCYSNLQVIIAGGHTGFSASQDGATHQALEDLAIMRTLPNMTVISPADEEESRKAILALIKNPGPGYIRVGKHQSLNLTNPRTPFKIGQALTFREGRDLTIVAIGSMVAQAIDAADVLGTRGIAARVINMHTIKPIDQAAIIKAAQETGGIVTAEEHQKYGGLGAAVAEVVTQNFPVPLEFVAAQDTFGESGTSRELMAKYEVDANAIVRKSLALLDRKVRE